MQSIGVVNETQVLTDTSITGFNKTDKEELLLWRGVPTSHLDVYNTILETRRRPKGIAPKSIKG